MDTKDEAFFDEIIKDDTEVTDWQDQPYSEFSLHRWSFKWRTRGILAEKEIERLQEKIAKLQKVVEDILSRNKILNDIGPDASGADGDFISAGWLEDIAIDAEEALKC